VGSCQIDLLRKTEGKDNQYWRTLLEYEAEMMIAMHRAVENPTGSLTDQSK